MSVNHNPNHQITILMISHQRVTNRHDLYHFNDLAPKSVLTLSELHQ